LYPPPSPRKPWLGKTLRRALIACVTLLVIGSTFLAIWLRDLGVFDITDSNFKTITNYQSSDATLVYDRQGKPLAELYSHYYVFTPYDQIPSAMIDAILSVEDRNFLRHNGVDLRGIARAMWDRLLGKDLEQGASTITQQLVRHFLLTNEKSLERKIKEIFLALYLETKLSKEKILEVYCNVMFMGNGAYGVGAAAQRFFGRKLDQLKTHEIAVIAGMFQSPSRYNPQRYPKNAKKRQLKVLKAMATNQKLTTGEAKKFGKLPLKYSFAAAEKNRKAPYFIDFVEEQTKKILGANIRNRGLRIHTTLDGELQTLAQDAVGRARPIFEKAEKKLIRSQSKDGKDKNRVEAALLVTDPKTGEILSMVGGRDYKVSQYNRAASALRAPGSAFKPVTYSLALERGYKWYDLNYIAPVAVDNYRPKNYSKSYLTETTLLQAFYKSVNTTAVEVGTKLGLKNVIEQAHKLGIHTPLRDEAGTILGSSEVSMREMATMYSVFANGGIRTIPIAITKITDRNGKVLFEENPLEERQKKALLPQFAFLMTEGLRAVFRYGTAARYPDMAEWAVGKTGTTNDARDNWFCGYSSSLVSIVWVGSEGPQGMVGDEAASTLALPIWVDFMKTARKKYPTRSFAVPENVLSDRINPKYGYQDPAKGIPFYFLKGQEPQQTSSDLESISRNANYRNLFEY